MVEGGESIRLRPRWGLTGEDTLWALGIQPSHSQDRWRQKSLAIKPSVHTWSNLKVGLQVGF